MNNRIKIEGQEYPCRMTMGAMLQFKADTGKEVTEVNGTDLSLVVFLLYACAVSSCRAEHVAFPYKSAIEMADYMAPEDLVKFQNDNFKTEVIKGDPKIMVEKKKV